MSAGSASDVAVGGVFRERGGVDDDDFCDFRGGEFRRHRIDARAEHRDLDWAARLLRRGDRLPTSRDSAARPRCSATTSTIAGSPSHRPAAA